MDVGGLRRSICGIGLRGNWVVLTSPVLLNKGDDEGCRKYSRKQQVARLVVDGTDCWPARSMSPVCARTVSTEEMWSEIAHIDKTIVHQGSAMRLPFHKPHLLHGSGNSRPFRCDAAQIRKTRPSTPSHQEARAMMSSSKESVLQWTSSIRAIVFGGWRQTILYETQRLDTDEA